MGTFLDTIHRSASQYHDTHRNQLIKHPFTSKFKGGTAFMLTNMLDILLIVRHLLKFYRTKIFLDALCDISIDTIS